MVEQFAEWSNLDRAAAEELTAAGWTLHPGMMGDEMACIAIMHGPEIHFVAAPKWRRRLMLRERTRAFLAPLMERHGYLTTRSDPSDGHRNFLERLGFEFTWNDGQLDHFMMCELPFRGKEN
jgi:hypothetical protein